MKTKELSLVETTPLDIPEMEIIKDGEIEKLKGGFTAIKKATYDDASLNLCWNRSCTINEER